MININFTKDGGQSGYTYSVDGCAGNKNVTFSTAETWLTVTTSSTDVTISAAASPTSLINSRTGTVTSYLNGNPCETFSITQAPGTICNCNSDSTFKAQGLGSAIASAGVSNATLGTYTADTNCITVSSTASVPASATWLTNLSVSGGNIKGNVAANGTAGSSSRSTVITISGTLKTDGTTVCTKTIPISQDGVSCACNTSTFSATGSSVAALGVTNAQVGTYSIDSNCITSVSGTGSVPSTASSWVSNITVSNNVVKATVSANNASGAQERSTIITISGTLKGGGTCTATLSITQPASSPTPTVCGCEYIASVSNITHDSGSGGTYTHSFTKNSSCTNTPTVTASAATTSDANWIKNISVNQNQVTYTLTENSGTSQSRTGTINLSVNGTYCTGFTVTQGGMCNCGSVDVFVDETYILVGNSPTAVTVCSGDTHGCANITYSVNQPDMISSVNVNINGSSFNIVANVKENKTGAPRSASFKFAFEVNGTIIPCDNKIITLQQDDVVIGICDCANVSGVSVYPEQMPAHYEGSTSIRSSFFSMTPSADFQACGWQISASTTASWVNIHQRINPSGSNTWCSFIVEDNPSTANSRTATIEYNVWNSQHSSCFTGSTDITQLAAVPCTCPNIGLLKDRSQFSTAVTFDGQGIAQSGDIYLPIDPQNIPSGCWENGSTKYSVSASTSDSWVTVTKGSNYYEINVTRGGNRTATAWVELRDENGELCDKVTKYITQENSTCDCSVAIGNFDTQVTKNISSAAQNVVWAYNYDPACAEYAISGRSTYMLPDWITSVTEGSNLTGITFEVKENTGSTQRSWCSYEAKVVNLAHDVVCDTYQLCVYQSGQTCECDSVIFTLTGNEPYYGTYCDSSKMEHNFSSYDETYTPISIGAKNIYSMPDISSYSCLSYTITNISGNGTNYIVPSISGNNVRMRFQNTNQIAAGQTVSVNYRVNLKKDSRVCYYEDKTFTLHGSYECCPDCNGTGVGLVMTDANGNALPDTGAIIQVSKTSTNAFVANISKSGDASDCTDISIICNMPSLSYTFQSGELRVDSTTRTAESTTFDIYIKLKKDNTNCKYGQFTVDFI